MAGDWIKIEKATARKREVLMIAGELGIHPDHSFGLCFRFWSWCDDNLSTGHALGVTNVLLDQLLGHDGFSLALINAGWLEENDGSLQVPNFDRHVSQSAKDRALANERKRIQRDKVTKESRLGRDKKETEARPEKRREEKSIKKEAKASCLASPDVLEKIWGMVPQISRTRSSQVKVKKEWDKIKPADKPTLETLTEALESWNNTEKWRDGYAEGLHIWINDRQWLNIPTLEPKTKPSGTREMKFGGRTGHVTKLEESK